MKGLIKVAKKHRSSYFERYGKGGAIGGAVLGAAAMAAEPEYGVASMAKQVEKNPQHVMKNPYKVASFTGHELTNRERLDRMRAYGYHGPKSIKEASMGAVYHRPERKSPTAGEAIGRVARSKNPTERKIGRAAGMLHKGLTAVPRT